MPKHAGAIIKRPCGIETEFGAILLNKGGDFNQSSSGGIFFDELNPSWLKFSDISAPWDPTSRMTNDKTYEHDTYFRDVEWQKNANFILENGARLYLDCSQPEISTPLCLDTIELLQWNRACYLLIDALRKKINTNKECDFKLIRNNVAGRYRYTGYYSPHLKRVSLGCHENYTTWRAVDSEELVRFLGCSWFVARTVVIGAGKIGCDAYPKSKIDFQMSQRSDFFYCIQDANTMRDRPLYNTRDVPYADAGRFRRAHVITGDSNMLQLPEYLKIGLTHIALMMIEDKKFPEQLEFLEPVQAFKQISWDIKFLMRYYLSGFKEPKSVMYILQTFRDSFAKYLDEFYPDCKNLHDIVKTFSDILDSLTKKDFNALYGKLDWVSKYIFIQRYCELSGKSWNNCAIEKFDYLYHDNDHQDGVFFKGPNSFFAKEQKIVSQESIARAMLFPPATRSRWIVETIKKFRAELRHSNYWDKVTFRHPKTHEGKTISFPDPTRPWLPEDEKFLQMEKEDFINRAVEAGILRVEAEYPLFKAWGFDMEQKESEISPQNTNGQD